MTNLATAKPLHLDVNEQIECAQTLASKFYTDPAVLDIEKARIFPRTWQLMGTLSQGCGEVNGLKRTTTSTAKKVSGSAIAAERLYDPGIGIQEALYAKS